MRRAARLGFQKLTAYNMEVVSPAEAGPMAAQTAPVSSPDLPADTTLLVAVRESGTGQFALAHNVPEQTNNGFS